MSFLKKLTTTLGPTITRKAKDAVEKNPDSVHRIVDRTASLLNGRVDPKHQGKIDGAVERAHRAVDDFGGQAGPPAERDPR